MARIFIDNQPFDVDPGKNLLETCLALGIKLPYFCWHPAMGSVGACRQCAVKIFRDENDSQGRIMMACMEQVRDNLYLSVQDDAAKEFRAQNIEWLMTNHPHDCAVCDEGGSCHLQDMTVMTGHAYRRFEYPKRTHLNQYLGPLIYHEMNRCIQCYRCVRYYKDYAGGQDLDVFAAHDMVYFGRAQEGTLESEFSGNLAEVCPTGVFTDKTLRSHYTRKWDMTMAPSVCPHCSLGCNTIAGERYSVLRQITNRHHSAINGYFLCDRGRYGYGFTNQLNRIQDPMIHNEVASRQKLFNTLNGIIKDKTLMGIGSPRASMEANFALRQLVGAEHFYQGVPESEARLTQSVLTINQSATIHTPSLTEIEGADVVLILGEDPTNSAPRLALSLRQTVRNSPIQEAGSIHVPSWNDAALRERIQDQSGPLYLAYPRATKLDELATYPIHLSPDTIADWGIALAELLEQPDQVNEQGDSSLQHIAYTLKKARCPVIVSGISLYNERILQAAYRLALALNRDDHKTHLALILPSCNSAGLAMLEAPSMEVAFKKAQKGDINGVVILENDLYSHHPEQEVDHFLSSLGEVIVVDYLQHATSARATILLPSATFAEGQGTMVSNEGRAQRYYSVFLPKNESIRPAWNWLNDLRQLKAGTGIEHLEQHNNLLGELASTLPQFHSIAAVAPNSDFRINGQKIPREPHRYSGRTAMLAHWQVSEPKPPVDQDSPFSYTMEGYRGIPPAPLAPFYWSPSWNSGQAVNQYLHQPNGTDLGANDGIRLFPGPIKTQVRWSDSKPSGLSDGEIELAPFMHIFGSEELSNLAPAIASLAPEPYLAISPSEAERYSLVEGAYAELKIGRKTYTLIVQIRPEMPAGLAGLPYQIPALVGIAWPTNGTITQPKP